MKTMHPNTQIRQQTHEASEARLVAITHLGTMVDLPVADEPQPAPEPQPGDEVPSTRAIPRGAVARDRYGDRVVRWPDGSMGRSQALRSTLHGSTFGPFTIERVGLTAAECDEAVRP